MNGFNAVALRFPDTDKLVILLNNTGEVELSEITSNILRTLHRIAPEEPTPKVRDQFYRLLQTASLDAAIAFYREQREQNGDDYVYNRWPLRILARQLMTDGRLDDAEDILQLNLETHADDRQTRADLALLQELDRP